ncbi:MAG: PAQR family membrane homeostasis protein TrhA [Gaiellaceae bacterium]
MLSSTAEWREVSWTGRTGSDIPLLRGVSHLVAFFASSAAGIVLLVLSPGIAPRLATAVFAASVTAMFAASALYHRFHWSLDAAVVIRRIDHAALYICIAGSYTAYVLLVLTGTWKVAILAAVWSGVFAAIVMKVAWADGPRWLAASIGIALGWIGVATVPQALGAGGNAAVGLVLAGGLLYTLGALVYALGRPDPFPRVFGFHEIFHVFVIGAVGCHYVAIALLLEL